MLAFFCLQRYKKKLKQYGFGYFFVILQLKQTQVHEEY